MYVFININLDGRGRIICRWELTSWGGCLRLVFTSDGVGVLVRVARVLMT